MNTEYIFLDCHPGLDMFTLNALTASNSVLIPVEAHILSSDGLDQVEKMIRMVQRRLNQELRIEGVIITKYQGNTNYCKQISELVTRISEITYIYLTAMLNMQSKWRKLRYSVSHYMSMLQA